MTIHHLTRSGAWLGAALFAAMTIASSANGEPVLSLGRTAVQGVPRDSGFVDLGVTPFSTSGTGYINVVSDLDRNGNTSNDWLVQNFAIPQQPGEFGTFSTNFSFTFGLGSLSPSGSFDVFASYTPTPIVSPSLPSMQVTTGVSFVTADIGDLQDGAINNGLDAGSSSSALPVSAPQTPAAQAAQIIGRVRHDIPGIKQGKNECAPTSAAQSLLWLKNRQGLQGLPNQNDLIDRLKRAMSPGFAGGVYPGIDPQNFVPGKNTVVSDLSLRVKTKRGGEFNGTGTFDFIKQEIERGEDVEMRIQYTDDGGHWVTIAGWFDDGTTRELFFKDPLTGGTTVDSYRINGTTITNYKYGAGTISFAVSESIIPEPGTILNLLLAFAVMAALIWRRTGIHVN